VPPRTIGAIRYAHDQRADDIDIFVAGRNVERLRQIVADAVVALSGPLARDLRFRRAFFVTDLHGERRDPLANEAVLIAADEAVALRLRIGLHANGGVLRDRANVAAEIR